MKRIISLVLLAMVSGFVLMGCTPTAVRPKHIFPEQRPATSYTVGQSSEANVGQAMIHGWLYNGYLGFLAVRDFQDISVGSLWCCRHKTEKGDYICEKQNGGSKTVYAIITQTGDYKAYTMTLSGLYTNLPDRGEPNIFVPKYFQEGPNVFDWELIYSGKQGSSIKIYYREFLEEKARPSFYQGITYDLSESNEISFKNLQIEVYQATNNSIVFAVKRD